MTSPTNKRADQRRSEQERTEQDRSEQEHDDATAGRGQGPGEKLAKEIRELSKEEPTEGAPRQSYEGDPSAGASGPGGDA